MRMIVLSRCISHAHSALINVTHDAGGFDYGKAYMIVEYEFKVEMQSQNDFSIRLTDTCIKKRQFLRHGTLLRNEQSGVLSYTFRK